MKGKSAFHNRKEKSFSTTMIQSTTISQKTYVKHFNYGDAGRNVYQGF